MGRIWKRSLCLCGRGKASGITKSAGLQRPSLQGITPWLNWVQPSSTPHQPLATPITKANCPQAPGFQEIQPGIRGEQGENVSRRKTTGPLLLRVDPTLQNTPRSSCSHQDGCRAQGLQAIRHKTQTLSKEGLQGNSKTTGGIKNQSPGEYFAASASGT